MKKETRNNIIGGVLFALPVMALTIFLTVDDRKLTEDTTCSLIGKSRSTSCEDITKVSEPNAVTLVALGALLISSMRRIK